MAPSKYTPGVLFLGTNTIASPTSSAPTAYRARVRCAFDRPNTVLGVDYSEPLKRGRVTTPGTGGRLVRSGAPQMNKQMGMVGFPPIHLFPENWSWSTTVELYLVSGTDL